MSTPTPETITTNHPGRKYGLRAQVWKVLRYQTAEETETLYPLLFAEMQRQGYTGEVADVQRPRATRGAAMLYRRQADGEWIVAAEV